MVGRAKGWDAPRLRLNLVWQVGCAESGRLRIRTLQTSGKLTPTRKRPRRWRAGAGLRLATLRLATLCAVLVTAGGAAWAAQAPNQTGIQNQKPSSTDSGDTDRKILQDQLGEQRIRRTRLYLKDGSYQVVVRYQVAGNRVRYISAERAGDWEEVPLGLVDWDATRKWEKEHAPGAAMQTAPTLPVDPEELKDRADKAARMPEVRPDLFLPEDGGVLALDTFRSTPELAQLKQSQSEAGADTSHNILKAAIHPQSVSHQLLQLPGIQAKVQLHVDMPVLYVSLEGGTPTDAEPRDFKVDTRGAGKDTVQGGSPASRYVIVRADVRRDLRVVGSFNLSRLGDGSQSDIIVETQTEVMPGGRWMKLTPSEPLAFGEYALMEVLSQKEVNLGVWDFGVHPVAPENREVILPLVKKRLTVVER